MLSYKLNPTLQLERVGDNFILSFEIEDKKKRIKANPWDLLALKLVSENLDLHEIASSQMVELSFLQKILAYGEEQGYLLRDKSLIFRKEPPFQRAYFPHKKFVYCEVFTLQWHLTNKCDLRCKHCYDRRDHGELSLEDNLKILEDFYSFCKEMKVHGQISFSGGNPFLYPYFFEIYKVASEMGFTLSILGNPVKENLLERLSQIERPVYFQVSLEGLEETNDFIRGKGHFKRTLDFLNLMRSYEIPNGVMMTIHERNIHELIPLATVLADKADSFSFNRLSNFGEGKCLTQVKREEFFFALEKYLELAEDLPFLDLKDNFFNYILYQRRQELIGGCTGFGCGAAFNFVALLPNGEVHACRKFPSSIGNLKEKTLLELYLSPRAEKYRLGPKFCLDCKLYGLCRGCLAVISANGLNPFIDPDPFCPGKII